MDSPRPADEDDTRQGYDYRRQGSRHPYESVITIERDLDRRPEESRFCTISNPSLRLVIAHDSLMASLKIDSHEIIIDRDDYHHSPFHDSWVMTDRNSSPRSTMLPWHCHVRGNQLTLSAFRNNSQHEMHFQMLRTNELHIRAKFPSDRSQFDVVYFNLNDAARKVPIDGHVISINCSGNPNRIHADYTRLRCDCNWHTRILPRALIGHVPFLLTSNPEPDRVGLRPDDKLVCDAIYSFTADDHHDHMTVKIAYGPRTVELNVFPHSNVFRRIRFRRRSMHMWLQSGSSSESSPASGPAERRRRMFHAGTYDCMLQQRQRLQQPQPQRPDRSKTIRIRIRITNYGICICPIFLKHYAFVYKFTHTPVRHVSLSPEAVSDPSSEIVSDPSPGSDETVEC